MILTSSATEANCLLIKAMANAKQKAHIIVSAQEHPSIDLCVNNIEQQRIATISKVKSKHDGTLDVKSIISQIKPETVLISIMMINNETGIVHLETLQKLG